MESSVKPIPTYTHDPDWAKVVSRLVKTQMAATGMTYADLSQGLLKLRTKQTPENLRVKINRGNFGAQLFVQLFLVMGKTDISLENLSNLMELEHRD